MLTVIMTSLLWYGSFLKTFLARIHMQVSNVFKVTKGPDMDRSGKVPSPESIQGMLLNE